MLVLALLVVLPAGLAAQVASTSAVHLDPKWVQNYAKLQAKAAKQQGHKLAETLATMAAYDYTFADTSFKAHDASAADQYMAQMTAHADQACALLQTQVKLGKKDGIKHVEENIQRISFGLRGLEQSVGFRQQAKVKAAVDHFTDLNYELLQWLFAPKS